MNLTTIILHIIPRNLISRINSWLFSCPLPNILRVPILKTFIRITGIDIKEANYPITHYQSIQELFIRTLKPNIRQIAQPICSPCDGTLSQAGEITHGTAIQAKGLHYCAYELITGQKLTPTDNNLDLKWYFTIYLAPHNYHRVHSPLLGTLTSICHISGTLWPVNEYFANKMPKLFLQNERLIFTIKPTIGGTLYVAMVGAFNVGKMRTLVGPQITTNLTSKNKLPVRHYTLKHPLNVAAGQQLGVFMLGSTTICVLDSTLHRKLPHLTTIPTNILLGHSMIAD